ncbi:helix-turn-helix transcriptional regulator [Streptomyces flavofungini]|uniref:helix-turn-helix transcriptional regulator n=1 Tax=Streptomyces flavofungini TaxID=68200 RepID=UPI0025B07BFA|nr:LuxR C-terminal-related transcriptional regulator [Streptomyces flavofungini]WJV47299.1 LuxR C-terminal-related transcriptional regulator [Streptomyces flavofungini]
MVVVHRSHAEDEMCEAGIAVYTRAVEKGSVRVDDAQSAPCLLTLGLLRPDGHGDRRLLPTAPAVALPELLDALTDRIREFRRRELTLAAAFKPFVEQERNHPRPPHTSGITVLHGLLTINEAINRALDSSHRELITVQPGVRRLDTDPTDAIRRTKAFIDRGGGSRTLYQDTARYSPWVMNYYEQLGGQAEVRTLDELPKRLLVFDREVAFIPGDRERRTALMIRTPALVSHFVTTFNLMWRLATPLFPKAAHEPAHNGITSRQRAIAALLTEGLTDADIAARLGMNVRTARVHIAKLSAILKSTSRAQLGYLIGRSGILDQNH